MSKKLILAGAVIAVMPTFLMAECDAGSVVQQLSNLDRASSSGTVLTAAAGMIQQARFNVISNRNVDLYDTQDDLYDRKEAWSKLNNDLSMLLTPDIRLAIEGNENVVVTVNFQKCLDELPKAVGVGVSKLTVLPDGLDAYALHHFPYTDYQGSLQYEIIANRFRKLGYNFSVQDEAEMTLSFVGRPNYTVVQLPERLFCGSLGCNFVVFDHSGNLLADAYAVPGEVYVRRIQGRSNAEILFFNADGGVVAIETSAENTSPRAIQDAVSEIYIVANTLPPDDYLSLRTNPSTQNGTRLLKMPNGTELEVLERRADGWWRVHVLENGQTGWAKSGNENKLWIVADSIAEKLAD